MAILRTWQEKYKGLVCTLLGNFYQRNRDQSDIVMKIKKEKNYLNHIG
jgi:hypothetical protein